MAEMGVWGELKASPPKKNGQKIGEEIGEIRGQTAGKFKIEPAKNLDLSIYTDVAIKNGDLCLWLLTDQMIG